LVAVLATVDLGDRRSLLLQIDATMPKSKASADGEEHLQEFQLLKQDVQDNQQEISAMRADLSAVGAKQDHIHHAMDGMQSAVEDLSLKVTAMAETLKSLHLGPPTHQPASQQQGLQSDDRLPPTPSAEPDQTALLRKKMEVDALRRQYAYEQDVTRRYQQLT
jgi:hypothetical protein